MSTGTFTPNPGAASLARQVLAQASMESRLMLRNGEQLLLAVVIPVIVLIGGVAVRSVQWLRGAEVATDPAPAPELAEVR